ncbi:putative oxidoreductase protein [Dioscorea alata]|uniref:Oxidoreductase protein n=1 Tax=Dioscorea alata TaxID=55571 RepID=A0ACB7V5S9_DIOAL|nr:putative oxidoreductase protein [Dioscorea alata]
MHTRPHCFRSPEMSVVSLGSLSPLASAIKKPALVAPACRRARSLVLSRFSSRISVRCSYTVSGSNENSSSVPVDDIADVESEPELEPEPEKIVVLGGSGFVGTAICKVAVSEGFKVVSLSRSGRPSSSDSWVDQVTWVEGDVFHARWDEVLVGAAAVVSTLGGFGNEEQMKKINGDANILAVNAAKDYGVPKFIMISVHDYNLPSFLLSSGYFTGKRKAESEVLAKYPSSGVVLRPGFIYGKRKVDGFEIPLNLIGEPLEKLLSATRNFAASPLRSLPASDLLLAPPIKEVAAKLRT